MPIELEEELRELPKRNGEMPLVLERAGIEALRQKEFQSHHLLEEIADYLFTDIINWAKLHSEDWKQMRQFLIERSGEIRIDDEELDWFTECVREGLVPVNDRQAEEQRFFNFTEDHFVVFTKKEGQDKLEKATIYINMQKTNGMVVGGMLQLENLIPQNFVDRFTKYLWTERKKASGFPIL